MGGDYERMGAGEDSLRSKFVVVLLMKGVVWLVTTGTCSLERLEGGSKVNHNIGKHDFWINNPKMARPQDIVALDNEQNGNFNFARMTYVGGIAGFSINIVTTIYGMTAPGLALPQRKAARGIVLWAGNCLAEL